ncbi:hypothetical protein [Arthrobacter sp. Br18]|uniref:hypothetical protein n=1 Tax=Arthrobacter sp. Br18 TaxID=1312954 RepID=UPI00047EB1EB|nr:hypothetical protein [Arthrobacter sp. Br18]
MNSTNTGSPIEIRADNVLHLEERLNAAVEDLQHVASGARSQGILIDRVRPDYYTVSLSHDVPYGVTHEKSY